MRLLAFRVREFRSVDDTGWIEAEQVTALIGTNEAGKTNVLTPLWKLKPAKDGAIEAIADYPRKRYNTIREMVPKPIFIDARFEMPESLSTELATILRVSPESIRETIVSRDFEGTYFVTFRRPGAPAGVSREAVVSELRYALDEVTAATVRESERALKQSIEGALTRSLALMAETKTPDVEGVALTTLEALLAGVDLTGAAAFSAVTGRFGQLTTMVTGLSTLASDKDRKEARDLVVQHLPSFVYYSNFGNLDSEIYLPHVIENLKREDLGSKEAAKARTLKVLFDFVRLSPEEILGLGTGGHPAGGDATASEAEIAAAAKQKKEREILLQSAATDLTRRFREWWRQGNYVFRFQADGDHFRIWVSDGKRPEPIELEARSTGLQWFLSFYLVFLVESLSAHHNSILLLDEPGLSLHPLAQHDLSAFFDGLARTNQLIYTTHSPFMVETDHLDRARSVYSDSGGVTQVSSDLRAPADRSDQAKSVYAAYAAVAIDTADAVIYGSQPVIVEKASDQHYFTAMKNYLVARGDLRPSRDILFLPGGNVKGARVLSGLVVAQDDPLPYVILDSHAEGRRFALGLKAGLYSGAPERILAIGDYRPVVDAEVEDLFPVAFMAKVLDRYLRKPSGVEEDFADVVTDATAFLPQAEEYARVHGIPLDEGWQLDFARRVKSAVLRSKSDILRNDPQYLDIWRGLFAVIHPQAGAASAS